MEAVEKKRAEKEAFETQNRIEQSDQVEEGEVQNATSTLLKYALNNKNPAIHIQKVSKLFLIATGILFATALIIFVTLTALQKDEVPNPMPVAEARSGGIRRTNSMA